MPAPSIVDLLRHIAREEPLPGTVRAFRGLTREHLGRLLEDAAERLAGAPVAALEPLFEPGLAGGPEPEPILHVHAEPPAPAAKLPRRTR